MLHRSCRTHRLASSLLGCFSQCTDMPIALLIKRPRGAHQEPGGVGICCIMIPFWVGSWIALGELNLSRASHAEGLGQCIPHPGRLLASSGVMKSHQKSADALQRASKLCSEFSAKKALKDMLQSRMQQACHSEQSTCGRT